MCCIDIALVWPYCLLVVGNHRWSFLWLIFIGCPISLQPHWSDHHLAGSTQGLAPDEPACPSQFCASPAATYHEPSQWCVSVDFVKFSFYISGSAWNALCNFQQWMAIISVLPLHNVHSVFFSTCIFCVFTYVKQNNKKKKEEKNYTEQVRYSLVLTCYYLVYLRSVHTVGICPRWGKTEAERYASCLTCLGTLTQ